MSEKRKPSVSMLLKKLGKEEDEDKDKDKNKAKNKSSLVEFFDADLWPEELEKFIKSNNKDKTAKRYRIRVNRKWHSSENQKFMFFTEFEAKNILIKSLKQIF